MNVVDEIYLLIKNDKSRHTLDNNIDYFQKFYYSSMCINNDYRVIEIFKYLLSLDLTDDFEPMPYLISKIFKSFNDYEMMLTQYCYLKDANLNSEYVKSLFSLINDYYSFINYAENATLTKLIDELNFTRDYTGSMMITLNASFFELPVDMIQQMFLLIKNNIYLQDIIKKGTMNKKMLDLEYIHDYLNRFLFTAEFMNKENINNDELMISLKNGKITDYETLLKITKKCPIEYLLNDEKQGISSFLDIVNKALKDPYERQIVFNTFLSKLGMIEDNRYLLNFIMNDERAKSYIEKNDYDEIIYMAANYDLNNLDSKTCMFLLNKTFSMTLLVNLKEKIKQSNFSLEEQEKIKEETSLVSACDYSFKEAIEILDKVFKDDKKDVDYMMVFGALKSLAKTFMGEEIYVYLTEDNNIYGRAYQESKSIVLNVYNIKDLLEKNNLNEQPEVLHIITTLYHECRHLKQKTMMTSNFDDNVYEMYKEEILMNSLEGYYTNNYRGTYCEKDARITGNEELINLLEIYFPYMQNAIFYYKKQNEKEYNEIITNKKTFELSMPVRVDEAIEKLVQVNPELLNTYPWLKHEYNINGTRKDKPMKLQ